MLRKVLVGAVALLAGSATMSFAAAKDDLAAAAKKLADGGNYSWATTTESAAQGGFTPGPVNGKTQKDGLTMTSVTFNDQERVTYSKGDKSVSKGQDGAWMTAAERQAAGGGGGGGGRGRGGFGFGGGAPAAQAALDIINKLPEVKMDNGVYTATVTGDAVRDLAGPRGGFGGRRGGGGAGGAGGNFTPPPLTNAKGSFKGWIKDGVLTKYEVTQQYSMEFNGNAIDVNNTRTTVFKDIGSTKVDAPAEAKAKLDQ